MRIFAIPGVEPISLSRRREETILPQPWMENGVRQLKFKGKQRDGAPSYPSALVRSDPVMVG